MEKHGHTEVRPVKGHQYGQGWSTRCMRRGWELWLCSTWRKKGSGGILLLFSVT